MSVEKVAEIYLRTDDTGEEIVIEWRREFSLKEKLGLLEWGKALVVETTKFENEEEGDE